MARSLNLVQLIGNVGREPETRYTSSGVAVATFSVATNRSRQDGNGNWTDEVEWHRVVAWDRQAEFVNNYITKGRKVYVSGRLQTRKWTDQQGNDKYTTEIVAREVMALDRAADSEDDDDWDDAPPARETRRPQRQSQPQRRSEEHELPEDEFADVPF